jgi:hypothetical protein
MQQIECIFVACLVGGSFEFSSIHQQGTKQGLQLLLLLLLLLILLLLPIIVVTTTTTTIQE